MLKAPPAGAAAGAAPPAGAAGAAPAPRLARYSAKDSVLWIACCLPFGSFGSYAVGSGSRVASPPPKPLPPSPIMILDWAILGDIIGAVKAAARAMYIARRRKRNMVFA